MKSLKMIPVLLGMTSLTACGLETVGSSVVCVDRLCSMNEYVAIDQSGITGSMSYTGDGIHAQGLLDDLLSLTPTLTLVGTIAPPLVNGVTVQASDITVNGSKVYMAYNTAGETQAGAIDVIDIATPTAPVLASEALYPTSDIHKVLVNAGKLYAAGANGDGAILHRITLDGAGKLTSTISSVALRSTANAAVPAYAGIGVAVAGSYVYALSGNNGGLSVLNLSNLTTSSYTDIPEARDIAVSSGGTSVYVNTGKIGSTEAAIKNYSLAGVAQGANVTLPNAQVDGGKSTILSGSSMQVATAGYGGARLICIGTGATLGTASNPAVSGLATSKTLANAAAFGGGYMFVANGEAGVSIYSVNTPLIPNGCTLVTITALGRFSLGGVDASANNVYYTNGYLVVATGSKGFKIVKVTTSVLSGLLQAL